MMLAVIVAGVPPCEAMADPPSRSASRKVSIAMVAEALQKAGADPAIRERMGAYVSGLVETMAVMNDRVQKLTGHRLYCKPAAGSLDGAELMEAFHRAAPDQAGWGQAEATPVIVDLLIAKYPCP
ncbi:hypothetical protein [Rhodovastum atsumiense]|uniref:Rap1a immunity protein domain-containing protein n=1 Tax=Rhodovastum atsumiense TaxID=504468 RepID=A0A5M6IS25_9PROT|nr:hypothetical protein [Rhodovastum atsumiense]KAA5610285.1 hypothetical protein F1189_20095 [Rhodovastum atsumiense]